MLPFLKCVLGLYDCVRQQAYLGDSGLVPDSAIKPVSQSSESGVLCWWKVLPSVCKKGIAVESNEVHAAG